MSKAINIAQPTPRVAPQFRMMLYYNPPSGKAALSPVEGAAPSLEDIAAALWILLRDTLMQIGVRDYTQPESNQEEQP